MNKYNLIEEFFYSYEQMVKFFVRLKVIEIYNKEETCFASLEKKDDYWVYTIALNEGKFISENIKPHRPSLEDYKLYCESLNGVPPEFKEQTMGEQYIIVMDCETNGLIKQRGVNPTPTNLNMFPRIVQFSWGLYTETGECKEIKDFIIKPNGWATPGSAR